jgi:hypothetical protein
MKSTKTLSLAFMAIVCLAAILSSDLIFNSEVQVVGSLTPADVTRIKAIVFNNMANQVLGPPGRRDFWKIPRFISYWRSHSLGTIEAQTNNTVIVLFKHQRLGGCQGYILKKDSSGWTNEAYLFE